MNREGVLTVPTPSGKGWRNEVNGRVITRHPEMESAEEAGREIARRLRLKHRTETTREETNAGE